MAGRISQDYLESLTRFIGILAGFLNWPDQKGQLRRFQFRATILPRLPDGIRNSPSHCTPILINKRRSNKQKWVYITIWWCEKRENNGPRMASQASFRLLWRDNSWRETSLSLPPVPVRSAPELVRRIQSIKERPCFNATLFRGLPTSDRADMVTGAASTGSIFPSVSVQTDIR